MNHKFFTIFILSATYCTPQRSFAEGTHPADDAFYAAAAALLPPFQGVPAPVDPADCQSQGGWGNVINFPHVPVTAANLPDGRVLTFASNQRTSFPNGPEFTYGAVYNPDTGVITELNWNQHDMFCGGTVLRADGKMQVMGGRSTTQRSSIFNWATNTWTQAANMNDPRWYTTSVALPAGDVFTVSGSGGPNTAERYNGTAWSRMTGIDWSPVANYPSSIESNWTPFIFMAPNGKLIHAGPTDVMNWIDLAGNGVRTSAGVNVPGTWYPKDAAVAVYEIGKAIFAGGLAVGNSETPTNKVFTLDFNTTPPTAVEIAPMQFNRRFANAITLPNGEVMVMGGNTTGQKFSDVGTVLKPEIWNPRTGQWRTVADMSVPRNYHSVALLLADGRVLSGGGGLANNPAVDHTNIQLYNPPCLFTSTGSLATRPALTQAPTSIGLTGRFTVNGTTGLKKFSFIRMTSITHGFTADQRFISLPFTETSAGNYELSQLPNRNVMTPGYWMLFGLDANGVHSKARIIKVDEAATVAIPGTNLALGKSAIQSSDSSASNTAAKAVDGVVNGNFTVAAGASTNTESAPFWEVDLGSSHPINAVQIINRTDNGGVTLKDFNVHVSNFPFSATNTEFSSFRHSAMVGSTSHINIYRNARYVRVQLNGTGSLQLAEVQVFGNSTPVNSVVLQNPGNRMNDRNLNTSLQLSAVAPSTVTYAASGLPPGLTLNPTSGLISGSPTTLGTYAVTVSASVPGISDTESFSWTIYPTGERPGVRYRYYEGNWTTIPAFETLTPVATGEIANFSPAPKLRPDQHAFLYESCIRIPTGGSWTFYLNSDDGSQIWIDGALAVNHNGVHVASEKSASVTLTAGVHLLVVAYFQSVGTSSLNVSYSGPGVAKQLIPDAALFQPAPGVHYDYFEGAWTNLPNFSQLTPLKSGELQTFSLAPRISNDNFGFRFQGQLRVFSSALYTFYTTSDDGSKLWINGNLVVNNDGAHGPIEAQGQINLTAGWHDIRVEYFEAAGTELLEVRYSAPGLPKQLIPATALAPHGLPGSPPVITPIASQLNQIGNSINLPVVATDPNGDSMTYSATGLPAGLNIASASGIIVGTPTTAGASAVTVTVTDATGRSSSINFNWTITSQLNLQPLSAAPKLLNTSINYSVISAGGINPRFSWNFGDGTPETAYSATRTIAHTFANPGRYQITITATDDTGFVTTTSFYQAIHAILTANRPSNSSPLAYEIRATGGDRVWNVNPDQDTVSVFNASTNVKAGEIAVGDQPVSIAIAPNGTLWVVNKKSSSISLISPTTLSVTSTLTLARAAAPHGLAFSPTGNAAYVALENLGQVLQLNPSTGATIGTMNAGNSSRHLSVSADGSKLFVSRFITPFLPGESTAVVTTTSVGAEINVFATATLIKTKTILLQHSEKPDAENAGRGIPNYLAAPVISPDGLSAWVPSKQDNIQRGTLRNGVGLTHDSTLRAIASRIVLGTSETEDYPARIDFDDSGMPSASAFDNTGSYLFVALEASREIAVVSTQTKSTLFKFDAGRAPQGLTVSPDNNRLYVHNFMDRTVTVYNILNFINGGPPSASQISLASTWNSVAAEALSATVLKGKQFFYDSRDPRLALQAYISCASCHNDGGHDGRVWDFTGVGEGLRNTTDLRGKAGTAGQGPVHWTGNFDEIQDFEKQIRDLSRGSGLMSDAQFNAGTRNQPLGDAKAGVSPDLDALAAYVASLTVEEPSPHRNTNATLTSAAVLGKEVFRTANCAQCHGGTGFSDSALNVLRNVGTLKPSSGKRLGATLTGLDTPSLRGVWASAPYLHDGSAANLTAAVQAHTGVAVAGADLTNLVAYLQQIDVNEPTAPSPNVSVSGLKAEFFSGTTPGAGAPLLTRTDAIIDFDWGTNAPAPQVPADNFSVRWTGFLSAPYSETFTIYAPADDGVRIWINNQLVLNQWPLTGSWPNFTIALTAGQKVPIKVEHYDGDGGATIGLYWFSNSQAWEAIPDFSQTGSSVNHPPAVTTPITQTSVRTKPATYQVLAADQNGDTLTYSATGLPAGLSINSSTGLISGTVGAFAAATNTVTVTVSDPGSLTAAATFTWNTTAPPANSPPVISAPGNQSFVRGTIASMALIASDPDGSALTWSAANLPLGLSINSTTGLISGTVSTSAAASGNSTVTVKDPGNLTASTTFNYVTTAAPLNGLKGEYFDGTTPGVGPLLLTRTDATIDFDWGSGSPAPTIPMDQFSARWTGELTAAYTETYNFSMPADNGVRVWINNQLVLDKWSPSEVTGWHNFTAPMTANVRTPIKIEYFEGYGGAGLTLFWYSVRQGWEVIPTSRLFPASTLPPNSAETAVNMVTKTQNVMNVGDGNRYLAFRRPSSSSAIVNLIVEESTNLTQWEISNHPAYIYQENDGLDYIYIPLPVPGTQAAAGLPVQPTGYYRVRFVAPDQYTTQP